MLLRSFGSMHIIQVSSHIKPLQNESIFGLVLLVGFVLVGHCRQ